VLRTLWKGWLVVARKIGYFQSQVILALVYFVVIAPFALAVRLFSDPLRLHGNPSWRWLPREGQCTPRESSVKQQF